MITDIHTHILPEVDDGASSVEESLSLLKALREQGVTAVAATPHFYAATCPAPRVHSAEIAESFAHIKAQLGDDSLKLFSGHEVHYFSGICACDDLRFLTYGGTNKILIELPFGRFDRRIIDEVVEVALNYRLSPVLAHIERYADCGCFESVLEAIDDGFCKAQLNCDSLLLRHMRRLSLQLIDDGYISYIATDTHSVTERPPHMERAAKVISSKLGKKTLERLFASANSLADEAL